MRIVPATLVALLFLAGCSEPAEEDAPFPFTQGPEQELPSVGAEPTFELLVIGDFGTGSQAEHDISDAMRDWHEQFGVDAFLTTGDNIYPDGSPEYFEAAWNEPFGWVEESGIEMVASLGNHDVVHNEGKDVMELLDMPSSYYKAEVGDAEIFVLDGNEVDDARQTRWLDRSLKRSDAAWQIAVFHQPPYSCSRHGPTDEVIARWVPIFRNRGVDLVLNGHDHLYQRFREEEGVTYVVTGGGGTFLDGEGTCEGDTPRREVALGEVHHFVAVQGSPEGISARAIGLRDPVLDEFSISPSP
jgi:hypothetical protein